MFTPRSTRQVFLAFAGLALGATVANAAPITLPPGLNPGDTYRLVFVTAGTHTALDTDIAEYNSFVTTQANLNLDLLALGTTWKAIGSTATVTALTNLGGANSSDIYNLFGQFVATSNADLFDGTIANAVRYTQDANALLATDLVWTGSSTAGGGQNVLANGGAIRAGNPTVTFSDWLSIANPFHVGSESHHFYAMSGDLTVPGQVPEPGTIGLVLGPALLLLARHRRRRRATPTSTSDSAVD